MNLRASFLRNLQRPPQSLFILAGLITLLAVVPGCLGYNVGNQGLYRANVQSIYVPIFRSESLRRNLGERLTEAVVKQIEWRTPMKVVTSPAADSVLHGRIVNDTKRILAENINDEGRDLEVSLFVEVTWVDRNGQSIVQSPALSVAPVLLGVGETANFVPEGGQSLATAQQEAIDRLAAQIVSQMEVPW